MLKFNAKGLIGLCMALVLTITAAVPAFAAEVTPSGTPATTEPASISEEIHVDYGEMWFADETEGSKQTRGSLSGYKSVNVSGNASGYFIVDVSGSWSPWAGCTLKTSGFSSNATIEITVKLDGDEKFTKVLGPNTEIKNIAMLNVSPGGYRIEVKVQNNSNTGNIQVWFY